MQSHDPGPKALPEAPPDTPSPLAELLDEVGIAAFELAPERAGELERLSKKHGIDVFVDWGVEQFWFSCNPQTGRITLGLAALERLWAYSYAYGYVIHKSQETGVEGGRVALTGTAEGIQAMSLLGWAHLGERRGVRLVWPRNLPRPESNPPRHSLSELSNGLFRRTLGAILLHEVGHIVLGHQPNSGRSREDIVADEDAADSWAFDWVLHDGNQRKCSDVADYVLRTLGVTCALSLIATFEVYDRTLGGGTHPDPPDRLWRFLKGRVPYDLGVPISPGFAWFAAVCIVKLHLDHGGVAFDPAPEYPDSMACLSDMMIALKRHRTRR